MPERSISATADAGRHEETRRDFLYLTAGAFGAVGAALALWPFLDSMNPSADVLALSSVEVDLTPIAVGQRITVAWRGKPVFIDHRPAAEIEKARSTPLSDLIDPQPDAARVQKPEWLIVIGICTHLGCVPLGTKARDPRGDWGGWFCPCHGSQYDTRAGSGTAQPLATCTFPNIHFSAIRKSASADALGRSHSFLEGEIEWCGCRGGQYRPS